MRRRAKAEAQIIPFGVTRVVSGGEPETHVADPPKPLTQDEALAVLWTAKGMYQVDAEGLPILDKETRKPIVNPKWCDAFVYATLTKTIVTENRTIEKGTRVLVTMVSRFGHVGIRDEHLVPASNGYSATVQPDDLTDWNMAP